MSVPSSHRSTTLVTQALIFGRIKDGRTGEAPAALPLVRLVDRDNGQPWRLPSRVLADGSFVFFGQPLQVFPQLATRTCYFRLAAEAMGYQPATLDFDVGPAIDQPTLVIRPVPQDGIEPMQVRLFTGAGLPQRDVVLTLQPNRLQLRGVVRVSNNPEIGVAGASISLSAGQSATTDADGAFEFTEALPLVSSVEVKAACIGYDTAMLTYELDYTHPINTLSIGLKSS